MAAKKKTKNKPSNKSGYSTKDIISVILIPVSFFMIFSMFMPGKTGFVGLLFRDLLTGIFSVAAYGVPFIILALATNYIIEKRIHKFRRIYINISILLIIFASVMQLTSGEFAEGGLGYFFGGLYTGGMNLTGGGIAGGSLHWLISTLLGNIGATILYIFAAILCFVFLFNISLSDIYESVAEKFKTAYAKHKEKSNEKKSRRDDEPVVIKIDDEIKEIPRNTVQEPEEFEISDEDDIIIGPGYPIPPELPVKEKFETVIEQDNQVAIASEPNEAEEKFTPEYADEYIENYIFPDIEMLKLPKKTGKSVKEQDLMKNARKLVDTLASFGVQAKILQVSRGPAITRYELQPMAGVKVSKIVGLADDIALNLAASGVRIEAPIPGKAAIGIEVPNSDVDMVSMREVIDCDEFKNHPSKLAVALGKNISGSPIIIDLAKMPHLLIAGATGSGNSVCINSIITSIMYKANPNEVKLLLIDPKVVELSVYNGIPHLDTPVVTKAKKAAGALSWAVTEMMKRYDQFSENKVRDIKGYNAVMKDKGYPQMPQIVIIIDELADLMMVAPNEVEDHICRLAQLARAAGMHLVIATQRPSVNVITGIIKANIPSRIAFAVSSQIDSRTILDSAGAEKLLGRGDMLYHPTGSSKPQRIQGAFVSDSEVEGLVKFVKQNSEALYNPDIIEHIETASAATEKVKDNSEDSGDYDDMLPKAIDLIMEMGQASTSMIQRKLSVGYARAGRLMDQMEERGIVGPSEGSKPRQILLTKEQYLELKSAGMFDKPQQY